LNNLAGETHSSEFELALCFEEFKETPIKDNQEASQRRADELMQKCDRSLIKLLDHGQAEDYFSSLDVKEHQAQVALRLGLICFRRTDLAAAKIWLQRAYNRYIHLRGCDYVYSIDIVFSLGCIYLLEDDAKALRLLQEAEERYLKILGVDDERTIESANQSELAMADRSQERLKSHSPHHSNILKPCRTIDLQMDI
jgi:hypothetical protein